VTCLLVKSVIFKVKVLINSENYAFGEGSSTQKAQEEAAKNLLKIMESKN